ncbi:MAG: AraC family transcriptional regulator [bacterium]
MKTDMTATDRAMLDFSGYGISEVPLVGRYIYTYAHPPLRQHLHQDAFEVCLLQRGTQAYVIDNSRFHLAAGDMIITRPGEIHGTDKEPESRGCLYWIQFLCPARNRSFLGLTPHSARLLIEPFKNLSHHQFHNCDLLVGTFERLLTPPAPHTSKELAKASIQNLLLRLLLDILSLTRHDMQQACSVGVKLALHHLTKHTEENMTLAQLATAAGTSESYLKAHFKREVGMSPMEYLMWLRIEKAKRALMESEAPITDLAFQLGFKTSQHFATAFKRFTATTPRDYRRLTLRPPKALDHPSAGTGPFFHPVVSKDDPRRRHL